MKKDTVIEQDEKFQRVRQLYRTLQDQSYTDADTLQRRVNMVRELEAILRTNFVNAADLKRKVKSFLGDYQEQLKPVAERIRRARRKKKWTQDQMARELGFKSKTVITRYEKGERMPPERVIEWLNQQNL